MNANTRESKTGLFAFMRGLLDLKFEYRLPEADLVARQQARSALVAMDVLSHAVPDDPQSAVGPAFIPTIVEQAVLAGLLVMQNVRVLARYRAVDGIVFGERKIVAPG